MTIEIKGCGDEGFPKMPANVASGIRKTGNACPATNAQGEYDGSCYQIPEMMDITAKIGYWDKTGSSIWNTPLTGSGRSKIFDWCVNNSGNIAICGLGTDNKLSIIEFDKFSCKLGTTIKSAALYKLARVSSSFICPRKLALKPKS